MLVYLQGIWQRLVKKTGRQVRLEILLKYVQCTKKNFVQREKRVTVEENKTKTHLKRKEKIKDDANIKESGSLTRTASKTNREILFADRCSAKSAIARHCTGWGRRATALSKPPKCNSAHYIGWWWTL